MNERDKAFAVWFDNGSLKFWHRHFGLAVLLKLTAQTEQVAAALKMIWDEVWEDAREALLKLQDEIEEADARANLEY